MSEARLSAHQISVLRNRWSIAEIDRVNKALSVGDMNVLPRYGDLSHSPCLYDLRGLLLTIPVIDRPLAHIDLAYSLIPEGTLNFGGFGTNLDDCRFTGADLRAGNIVVSAIRCDFSYCRFHTLMGTFEECSFREANLSRVNSHGLKFVQCDFTNANMLGFHGLHSTFDYCVWKFTKLGRGSFAGSRFISSWPSNETLGNTIMDDVKIGV